MIGWLVHWARSRLMLVWERIKAWGCRCCFNSTATSLPPSPPSTTASPTLTPPPHPVPRPRPRCTPKAHTPTQIILGFSARINRISSATRAVISSEAILGSGVQSLSAILPPWNREVPWKIALDKKRITVPLREIGSKIWSPTPRTTSRKSGSLASPNSSRRRNSSWRWFRVLKEKWLCPLIATLNETISKEKP